MTSDDMETCAPRKEPGQRAHEAFQGDFGWTSEWEDLPDVTQSRWARVEAALATARPDESLERLRELSKAAYPGPWIEHDEWISGTEREGDGGDIIADMPSEGEDSRAHWTANRALIVAAVNHVRAALTRAAPQSEEA